MDKLQQIWERLSTPRAYLLLGNLALVIFLMTFFNLGILPLRGMGDFIFLVFIALAFALYRPGWAFLLFVGTLILEIINLAPESIGLTVRPYQLLGGLLFLAVAIRFFAKRLNFSLVRLQLPDYLVLGLAGASLVSALFSAELGASLKLTVILISFSVFYLVARSFVSTLADVKKILPFMLLTSLVVVVYGIGQNIFFLQGWSHLEVMPGRPNGTFAEADWLGMYLVFLTAILCALVYAAQGWKKILIYGFLVLDFILLILTVSRSAWLGAFAVIFMYLFVIWTNLKINPKNWQWRATIEKKLAILATIIASALIVYVFQLTNFQLLNRAQSTASGLQKITIACEADAERVLPEKIDKLKELEAFGCRHINLEEIASEQAQGRTVAEIYRPDPNVGIRSRIYARAWETIQSHPLVGVGWGKIGALLGTDARGASLNASNIFLEVWLGAGLAGVLCFTVLWFYILLKALLNFRRVEQAEERAFLLFVVIAWFGLMVANLFNAGIFLGFFWVFLAVSLVNLSKE